MSAGNRFQIRTPDGHATLVGQCRGKGPPLVVQAPGWGCGGALFEQTLRPLAKHFTLITYDPRGSGDSTRAVDESTVHIAQQAADLQTVITALQLDAVHLLGHSHGAWIALFAALEKPARFQSLVLVGAEIDHIDDFERKQHRFIVERAKQPAFRGAATCMLHHMETGYEEVDTDPALTRWFEDVMPLYAADPTRLQRAFEATRLPLFAARAFRASAISNARFPVSHRLEKLHVPTLLVTGQQDFTGLLNLSDTLERRLPKTTQLSLDQAGHFPWLEQPTAFFAGVLEFLTAHS